MHSYSRLAYGGGRHNTPNSQYPPLTDYIQVSRLLVEQETYTPCSPNFRRQDDENAKQIIMGDRGNNNTSKKMKKKVTTPSLTASVTPEKKKEAFPRSSLPSAGTYPQQILSNRYRMGSSLQLTPNQRQKSQTLSVKADLPGKKFAMRNNSERSNSPKLTDSTKTQQGCSRGERHTGSSKTVALMDHGNIKADISNYLNLPLDTEAVLITCGAQEEEENRKALPEYSDSEDDYRGFGCHIESKAHAHVLADTFLHRRDQEQHDGAMLRKTELLSPSLFPNMPPYLTFSLNLEHRPKIPLDLQRVLKWRISKVTPKVVRHIVESNGLRWTKKPSGWFGVWGRHMKSHSFRHLRPYQKINHIPGSFSIGRKDSCWKHLMRLMKEHSKKEFGFMPRTYIIPRDILHLRANWPRYAQQEAKWIIKPPARARGAGVHVISKWEQIPKRRPLIVQKYIEHPLLIQGSKFDLRLYVLVTSVDPLRVFMYNDGLARFASVKYSDKAETLNDRCMHLTNYSINKHSTHYSKNDDVDACNGHKWSLRSLWNYLSLRGIHIDLLWDALRQLVLRTIMAGELSLYKAVASYVRSRYNCFELFGFDVLLDSELIPWLLEVNISPSLHSDLPIDASVKGPLVCGVLNTALMNIPPLLSPEAQRSIAQRMYLPTQNICFDRRLYIGNLSPTEITKHDKYTSAQNLKRSDYIDTILDYLTPDDVRCLVIAEDELARCQPLERIFPSNSSYKLLKYIETPRYYNHLLDAWENRYSNNRHTGIELLRSFCEIGYHLCVEDSQPEEWT